jgi:hypothetical protein
MSNRLRSPATIGEILAKDPDVLRRVVFLAAEVRQRQKAYFAERGATGGRAVELLEASKAHERKLDQAIDAITLGGQPATRELF